MKNNTHDEMLVAIMEVASELSKISDQLEVAIGCLSDRLEGQVDAILHIVLDHFGVGADHPLNEGLCISFFEVIGGSFDAPVGIADFPKYVREQLEAWREHHGR